MWATAEFADHALRLLWVALLLIAMAALAWVLVRVPIVGMGLIGCFMGSIAGLFIGAQGGPEEVAVGAEVGAAVGLPFGLLIGALLVDRSDPRMRELVTRWFLLAGFLGGGVLVWAIAVVITSGSDHWLGPVLLGGIALVFGIGVASRRRFPALGLILLLGLDGFAMGMIASFGIQASWGVEAGAAIGVVVGVALGSLVGWSEGRHRSRSSTPEETRCAR